MLSKFYIYQTISEREIKMLKEQISPEIALAHYGWIQATTERIDSGALSATFIAKSRGHSLFLKTHLLPEGRKLLEQEATFLTCLYQQKFIVNQVVTEGGNRLWILMPILKKNENTLEPRNLFTTINNLNLPQIWSRQPDILDKSINLTTLLKMAWVANDNLSSQNLLNITVTKTVTNALQLLDRQINSLTPTICHGDLSPLNIMSYQGKPVLIDWEDAFIGVKDYDYLFWLTFFANRKFYNQNPLQYISIDIRLAKALLIMITLLKCELAYRTKVWLNHSLSFNDRIEEISRVE